MSRQVDFDQICSEAQPGEPIEVKSGDKVFHLHPELPWMFAIAWDEGRVDEALGILVPEAEVEDFRDAVFSGKASRATALDRIVAIYRMEAGESSASSRRSANGSTKSRPTSKRTTG